MNEDAKKKLNEKLGAAVTDEQLDKVAGGTTYQNYELLNAFASLDGGGVSNLLEEAGKTGSELVIANGVHDLIQKHFGGTVNTFIGVNDKNDYLYNGNGISHNDMLYMIKNKVAQKKAEKDGWVFVE